MPEPNQRDAWVVLGMTVSATAATLTSFDGLRQLAVAAGWTSLMALLLPACIDAFAATATRVWLAASTKSRRAKRFARTCAVGAIFFSLGGNAAWHLIAAHLLIVNWIIVLIVGAIPPVVLGLISHLAVLRVQVDRTHSERTVLSPTPPTAPQTQTPVALPKQAGPPVPAKQRTKSKQIRPQYADQDDLLKAARAAAGSYQASNGKTITRDDLRQQLRIGGERATALLRQLKEELSEAA